MNAPIDQFTTSKELRVGDRHVIHGLHPVDNFSPLRGLLDLWGTKKLEAYATTRAELNQKTAEAFGCNVSALTSRPRFKIRAPRSQIRVVPCASVASFSHRSQRLLPLEIEPT